MRNATAEHVAGSTKVGLDTTLAGRYYSDPLVDTSPAASRRDHYGDSGPETITLDGVRVFGYDTRAEVLTPIWSQTLNSKRQYQEVQAR